MLNKTIDRLPKNIFFQSMLRTNYKRNIEILTCANLFCNDIVLFNLPKLLVELLHDYIYESKLQTENKTT